MAADRTLETLREAVRLSPENVPLRRHLAESYLAHGRPDLAEAEFRETLPLAPDDPFLLLGLSNAFLQQSKTSLAVVILEGLVKRPDAPPLAYLLLARLFLNSGQVEDAVRLYKKGVEADPTLTDREFADRLGIRPVPHLAADVDQEGDTDSPVVDGRIRASWEDADSGPSIEVDRPELAFHDVGGMDSVKEEIQIKIIHPMNHPELYKAYGKAVGGGILMYGPPGCGKTYLARATAGEIHAGFLSVGINDVLEMWIGNSEKNLHALFEQARLNTPCVLFFDEVDALAASRTDLRASGGRQLINQFLSELDGIDNRNDGVLILAATNAPWHLDAAFRRPGRFDRILFVPPPDQPARASILRLLCRGKPTQNIDYDHLAKKTDHFSGADLKAVLDLAIEAKLREAMKAGIPQPLTTKDLLTAAASIKPSTREWFATARNYALYSNQGGIYDDILKHLKL